MTKGKVIFPPIEQATEDGLLAIGGDLSIKTLLTAYQQGIFPWPLGEEYPLAWFAPDPRGVLYTNDFRVNRSLKKVLKRSPYTVKKNRDFNKIITLCGNNPKRPQGFGSWITPEIITAYTELFDAGYAYCFACYDHQQLVGGIYGVKINNFVSGESMFHLKDNASKVALYYLIEWLKTENIKWLDIQMVTPTLAQLGGIEISRQQFMHLLTEALVAN